MAKKKASGGETKSDFLRKVLSKNINLDYRQVNRLWAKKGYAGEISSALYYQIRQKLGIVTEWRWVKETETTKVAGSDSRHEVHQLKVTLLEIKPPIWRRIQVPDCTVDQLHHFIQSAMGWMHSHLYDFKIDGQSYGDPMMMAGAFVELDLADSTTTRLNQVLPRSGERFEYMYDFGDSWRHDVLYEGVKPAKQGRQYPCCLEGKRACPPEDVGGTCAYLDFLEAIANPKNPEHDELLEWVGGKFDPEAFSPAVATRNMTRGVVT